MKKQLIEMDEVASRLEELLNSTSSTDIAVVRGGAIRGYIVSPSRYQSLRPFRLSDAAEPQPLADEYEQMAARMQTPAHAKAVERLMSASTDELRAFFSDDSSVDSRH